MTAAKASKRVAADATEVDAKRAKVVLDPAVAASCEKVKAALATVPELPAEVVSVLKAIVPLSLGESKDQRHNYQTRVIDAIAHVLNGVETELKSEVEATQNKVQDVDSVKAKRTDEVAQMLEDTSAKESTKQQKKLALADEAASFRDARDALRQAETKKLEVESSIQVAAQHLVEARAAVGDWLGPLRGTATEPLAEPLSEAEASTLRNKLLSFLSSKEVDIDESLMTALPAALEKTPDARGPFDLLAIQELETVLAARVASIEQELSAADPSRKEQSDAVSEAQAARDKAAEKLRENADIFRCAQSNHAESECSLTNARKASRDIATELRGVARVLERVSGKLTKFQDGPLSAFNELRDRQQVPAAEHEQTKAVSEVPVSELATNELPTPEDETAVVEVAA